VSDAAGGIIYFLPACIIYHYYYVSRVHLLLLIPDERRFGGKGFRTGIRFLYMHLPVSKE